MTRNLAGGFVTALVVLCVGQVHAECQLGTPPSNGGSVFLLATPTAPVGQSFVACQDGLITSISVWFHGSTQQTIQLGLQQGTDLLAPSYTRMYTIVPTAVRMVLAADFPVRAGETYSFSLTPAAGGLRLTVASATAYPEGSLLAVEGGSTVVHPSQDLVFTILTTDPPVPAKSATWGAIKSTYR